MTKALRKLPRAPLLHQSVRDALRLFIVENNLQAGDALESENELAAHLGVSRNSMREAIKGLESVGILETRRGLGVFVSSFSFNPLLESLPYGLMRDLKRLQELLDIRQALEESMIGNAIEQMTEADLRSLESALQAMEARADAGEPFSDEDREFHRCLLASLHNETLIKLLDVFWLAFSHASTQASILSSEPLSTYHDHAAIVEAVAERNAERARTALVEHYRGIRERLHEVKNLPDEEDEA